LKKHDFTTKVHFLLMLKYMKSMSKTKVTGGCGCERGRLRLNLKKSGNMQQTTIFS